MNLLKTLGLGLGLSALLIGCDQMQPGSDDLAVSDTPTPVTTDMGQGTETMEVTDIVVESEPAADATDGTDSMDDADDMSDTNPNDSDAMPADGTMPTPDNTMQN